jgi:hypothetical protein
MGKALIHTRAVGDDTPPKLFVGQSSQGVSGTADLEGADFLEVFAFQEEFYVGGGEGGEGGGG